MSLIKFVKRGGDDLGSGTDLRWIPMRSACREGGPKQGTKMVKGSKKVSFP